MGDGHRDVSADQSPGGQGPHHPGRGDAGNQGAEGRDWEEE